MATHQLSTPARLWFLFPVPRAAALACCLTGLGLACSSRATERTWDGSARGDGWTDIGNWVGLGIPAAGDSLRFPAGAQQFVNSNDFAAGTSFNLITYAGSGYTARGNRVNLTGGLTASHASGSTVFYLPITLQNNLIISVPTAGATLFLNGDINLGSLDLTFDGAGQVVVSGDIDGSRFVRGVVRKQGSGRLWILQHLSYDVGTIVNGGTLAVDGSISNSFVTINSGATLNGTGKIGGLRANSGGTVRPGGTTSPDILDVLGNLELNAGSAFNVRLNGTSVGINYDQLKVQGTVTLGGTLNVTAGFTAAVGDTFTIIDNDGIDAVVGTFAGLPEGAILTVNGRPFQISYGGRFGGFGRDINDVTLEAVPALAVWDGGGGLNKFWSQPLNWAGDVLPMPGDDIQFIDAAAGTLTTINDFPAGRLFGSMIFAGGDIRIEGNLAEFAESIRLTAPGTAAVTMPVGIRGGIRVMEAGTVTMSGAIALRAHQTFRAELANSSLVVAADLSVENHNFTVDGAGRVQLSGANSGTGELTKVGVGTLEVHGTHTLPLTTVNAGTLNAGGGFFTGLVVVNAGGRLTGGGCCLGDSGIENLDVIGGTLEPSFGLILYGRLRMLNGATFVHNIYDQGANGVHGTYLYSGSANEPTVLSNCNFVLNITPNTNLEPGRTFPAIAGGEIEGTFNGLPPGARFLVDGHAVTINYGGGARVTFGAPFVWDGGGSGNVWGTAENWEADVAPILGSALIFPANVSKLGMINAFDVGTRFRSMTFGGPSYLLVGNSFRLTEGIYNDVVSGDTTISADFVTFGSYFSNRVSNASRLLLEGSVTGSARWKKTGAGTLRFTGTGANSQSEVEVREGELDLDKPSGVNAISAGLIIGDGTNDVRVTLLADHQIADSADVTIRSRGRLDMNGNDEAMDRLQGDGTVSMDGRFVFGKSARLTVSNGVFSGVITGNGGLTKVGSSLSTLSLSGENSFSGMTIVSGGTLFIEGIQTNSPIRLDGGGLRGRGRVGAITANLGGTLQPGSGNADFQVALHSRDVALNPATTFRALLTSIDPGYENHKLQVSGTVSLGGSVLSVDLNGTFKPAPGRSFVIIDNDGSDPVSGTFAGLPEGAVFGGEGLPFQITYAGGTGNDVVITRMASAPASFSSVTALGNGQVRMEGLGIVGVVYSIQAASNLNPVVQWTPWGNATGNVNGVFQVLETNVLQRPMRFFRAVSP